MAPRRTDERRGSDKRRDAKDVLRIARRARAEVAKLLRRSRAGTITQLELDAGLKEVKQELKRTMFFVDKMI
jgi:hypothetical protein